MKIKKTAFKSALGKLMYPSTNSISKRINKIIKWQ